MVTFIDRQITIPATGKFEYNFGVNTQFYANIVNSTPGQASGPALTLRVYSGKGGSQDFNVPYGIPIIQLGLVGWLVDLIGPAGQTCALTLSSQPIPLSATDIGQLSLYARGTVIPTILSSQVVAAGSSSVGVAVPAGAACFVFSLGGGGGGPLVSDDQSSTFVPITSVDVTDGGGTLIGIELRYVENLNADTAYIVSVAAGGNYAVIYVLTNVPTTGLIDSFLTGSAATALQVTLNPSPALGNELILAVNFSHNSNNAATQSNFTGAGWIQDQIVTPGFYTLVASHIVRPVPGAVVCTTAVGFLGTYSGVVVITLSIVGGS